MAKFKYIGDPNDDFSGPKVATVHGSTFVMGEVTDVDDSTAGKLRGHSHFVDMSDKDTVGDVDSRQKAMEKQAKDKQKAEEEQRKKDEADEKERQDNLAKQIKKQGNSALTSENAPRPPGKVTLDPIPDAFGGRTVEERTQVEDHTRSGKTKS